jgi:CheY-like chemotaxis protein
MILLAEDDPNDAELFKHALQVSKVPALVQIVCDGEELIEYVRGQGKYSDRKAFPFPSLILLDLKMPRLTGLEALEWLRKQPECGKLPVVMMSGSGLDYDIDRAYRMGVNTYFTKPARLEQLNELIRVMITYWLQSERPNLSSMC